MLTVGDFLKRSKIKKRSVYIAGHSTSLTIEDVYWDVLHEIASEKKMTVSALLNFIDRQRTGNFSSAVRLYVLYFLLLKSHGVRDIAVNSEEET